MDSLRGYYCKPSQRTGNRLIYIYIYIFIYKRGHKAQSRRYPRRYFPFHPSDLINWSHNLSRAAGPPGFQMILRQHKKNLFFPPSHPSPPQGTLSPTAAASAWLRPTPTTKIHQSWMAQQRRWRRRKGSLQHNSNCLFLTFPRTCKRYNLACVLCLHAVPPIMVPRPSSACPWMAQRRHQCLSRRRCLGRHRPTRPHGEWQGIGGGGRHWIVALPVMKIITAIVY
jgi:hypothetical protein